MPSRIQPLILSIPHMSQSPYNTHNSTFPSLFSGAFYKFPLYLEHPPSSLLLLPQFHRKTQFRCPLHEEVLPDHTSG